VVAEVLKLARRNPDWGYDRMASCMDYLGFSISESTVKRILLDHGLLPSPDQKDRIEWERFISAHKDVLAATDFFSVELLTEQGLERYMVLFFIDIGTRKVEIAGVTQDPDGEWMAQMGLGGKMIEPLPQDKDGDIVEFNYLGGLLRSYRRVKRAA
jgi:putative transposase